MDNPIQFKINMKSIVKIIYGTRIIYFLSISL
jgi:hypothetical protein